MLKSTSLVAALVSLACFAPGPVPAPWVDADVGGPGLAGSATFNPTTFSWALTGGGGDIWGTGDQFNYAYMPLNGDGSVTAHVATLTDSAGGATMDAWSKAGGMIRESTAAGSTYAFECFTGNNGTDYQFRTATGGGAGSIGQTGSAAGHRWVRMTRTGTSFSGYWSDDGVTWTLHGTQTITMATSVLIGLAVCAHNNGTTAIGTFDNVVVTDGSGNYLWPEAPPTGLSATAGVNAAALTWTAAPGATSYTVLRGTANGGPYPTTVASGITITSYTDTQANFPGPYYYVVQAVGPIGTSPYSNQASSSPLQPNISAAPSSLQVAENGGTAYFVVTLQVNPTANVVVQISSANPAALLLTAPGGGPQGTIQLTFVPGGALSQQVLVTGVEQHLEGPPVNVAITFDSVTSTDANFPAYYVPPPITCTIIEDSPAIIVNPPSGLATTNGGPAVTFTVQLATIPSGTVVLNLSVSDPNLATVSPTQISNAAWNNPVTVTVTPLNANAQTTYIAPYEIFIDPSQSTDPAYAALPLVVVPIDTPVSTPPLTKVWGGSGGGCGLLGAEALLPLFLLGVGRRRRRTR